jgi:hypothetical protein
VHRSEVFTHARVSYTLGYYPENQNYDGKFRKIALQVKQRDLRLTYRTDYRASQDKTHGEAELLGAVWSPTDATAIPPTLMLANAANAVLFLAPQSWIPW